LRGYWLSTADRRSLRGGYPYSLENASLLTRVEYILLAFRSLYLRAGTTLLSTVDLAALARETTRSRVTTIWLARAARSDLVRRLRVSREKIPPVNREDPSGPSSSGRMHA
jgi:hypothetical protein